MSEPLPTYYTAVSSPTAKIEAHISRARQQAKRTRRAVVITVIVNPDAPDQYFTGTIAGTFDICHETD